jgi:signal transduction histidine kinase/CheY-like chemotaxis protein
MIKRISSSFFDNKIIRDIFWWFDTSNYIGGQRLVNRIKFFHIAAVTILFIASFLNFLMKIHYSFALTAITCSLLIPIRYLIENNSSRVASYLLIGLLNIFLILLSYIEGTASGTFSFYFAILVTISFLADTNDKANLFFCHFFTLLALFVTFLVCPHYSAVQKISQSSYEFNFFINTFSAALISTFFSYYMLKDSAVKEINLRDKQLFLDSVYNTSLDAVLIVDIKTGNITDCNHQTISLFSVKRKHEIIGRTACDFFKELKQDNQLKAQLYNPQFLWKGELTCERPDGSNFSGYVSFVTFTWKNINYKKINVLDISDLKEVSNELQKAKLAAEHATEAKSKFVSNMSHELRTPLNAIIGTVNLLINETSMPEQKQHFNLLKFSSEHMLGVINDILDFSKIEAGKLELEKSPFNIHDSLKRVCSVFEKQFEQKQLALEVAINKNLDQYFIGDETRLNQVISNLVANALKFTANGKVVISAMLVSTNIKTATVLFSVQDTGIGIPYDKQKTIFENFAQGDNSTTRKFGGTGLGLSISKRIVESYGGELRLESVPGRGSHFTFAIQFELPSQNKRFITSNTLRSLISIKGMKILLAEDNAINMMIAKRFLNKWDVEVTEAVNGIEAVEKFRTGTYDLILLDLEMPEMDGIEALKIIRLTDENIPVIAFTAAVFENMHAKLINEGFNDYIQKPFRPEEFHEKIFNYYNLAQVLPNK